MSKTAEANGLMDLLTLMQLRPSVSDWMNQICKTRCLQREGHWTKCCLLFEGKCFRKNHSGLQLHWMVIYTATLNPPQLHTNTHMHTRPHSSHSFTWRAICSAVAMVILKPITALNLFLPEAKGSRGWKLPQSDLLSRKQVVIAAPPPPSRPCTPIPDPPPPTSTVFSLQPPPHSGEDSIINQFTSCEKHPPGDGNEPMADQGYWKTFPCRGGERSAGAAAASRVQLLQET